MMQGSPPRDFKADFEVGQEISTEKRGCSRSYDAASLTLDCNSLCLVSEHGSAAVQCFTGTWFPFNQRMKHWNGLKTTKLFFFHWQLVSCEGGWRLVHTNIDICLNWYFHPSVKKQIGSFNKYLCIQGDRERTVQLRFAETSLGVWDQCSSVSSPVS